MYSYIICNIIINYIKIIKIPNHNGYENDIYIPPQFYYLNKLLKILPSFFRCGRFGKKPFFFQMSIIHVLFVYMSFYHENIDVYQIVADFWTFGLRIIESF